MFSCGKRTNQSDGVGPKQFVLLRPTVRIRRPPVQTPHELQTLVLRLSLWKAAGVGAPVFRVAVSSTLLRGGRHPEARGRKGHFIGGARERGQQQEETRQHTKSEKSVTAGSLHVQLVARQGAKEATIVQQSHRAEFVPHITRPLPHLLH